ncbi:MULTISPECIES: hypothetical protein [Trichocoleus]|uniref:Uncharacterized protein n=1 Tax=Trichocoleus desertorum GB2-A4 TaxID=2933944 RepID=A0ABV0JAU9_9CYAN|nr:hypothetical protein [Trichocoleus sp. FACHB-46]MBD1864783.1 hypothetical protein [Trichocoleus sp. FACHB-46]
MAESKPCREVLHGSALKQKQRSELKTSLRSPFRFNDGQNLEVHES